MIPTYSTEKPQGKEQNTETFVEVGYFQLCKYNQKTEGDVFLSQKNPADGSSSAGFWYARLDSNQRPSESESDTLSN